MRATAVLVLALVLSAERGTADDAKTIQGTWVVTPATFEGVVDEGAREVALKAIEGMRFTFGDPRRPAGLTLAVSGTAIAAGTPS